MERAITGFHRDDEGDWVAELACGHGQHVRHRPPWTVRPWVTTEAGRASKLGARLECKRCGTIRPYALRDREACLALWRDNAPEPSSREEEARLADFLDLPNVAYFVVEDDEGAILAGGGIEVSPDEPKVATLCFGMVRPARRRQGLGRALTLHRLMMAPAGVEQVRVVTTEQSRPFYEKLGFIVEALAKEGSSGPRQLSVRLPCSST